MLRINTEKASRFISDTEFNHALEKAHNSLDQVCSGSGKGAEWLGWRSLLADPNDAILENISALADEIRQKADIFIVCGIGGSFLGAKAILEAFRSGLPGKTGKPEILFAGHQMGAHYHKKLLEYLDEKGPDGEPKSVYVNVISKSGTTLETALAFRLIRKWMHETYGEDARDRIICTTGPTGGILNRLVDQYGYRKFTIPNDVGGRFSVLTPVGLVPIAVGGVDIQTLFYGAVSKYEELEKDADSVLNYAAVRYALYINGKSIDVITSFEPELNGFCKWMQQLLGESEGKVGKGIFPTVASYSTDLHSIGQMVQQGTRNLLETIIGVNNPVSSLTIPELENDDDELNYLAGKEMHEINRAALEGTREAHLNGRVPVVTIMLDKLNPQQIGGLIYFYELFTAVYVYCLDVNPFDQPGVEAYKDAMYEILGKNK